MIQASYPDTVYEPGVLRTCCSHCGRDVLLRTRREGRAVEVWDRYKPDGPLERVRYCVACGRKHPQATRDEVIAGRAGQ